MLCDNAGVTLSEVLLDVLLLMFLQHQDFSYLCTGPPLRCVSRRFPTGEETVLYSVIR